MSSWPSTTNSQLSLQSLTQHHRPQELFWLPLTISLLWAPSSALLPKAHSYSSRRCESCVLDNRITTLTRSLPSLAHRVAWKTAKAFQLGLTISSGERNLSLIYQDHFSIYHYFFVWFFGASCGYEPRNLRYPARRYNYLQQNQYPGPFTTHLPPTSILVELIFAVSDPPAFSRGSRTPATHQST